MKKRKNKSEPKEQTMKFKVVGGDVPFTRQQYEAIYDYMISLIEKLKKEGNWHW